MEIQGKWTKDTDGFMDFETSALQRLYETVTDSYHQVYNRYLDKYDEEEAYYQALREGYEMVTDYKMINGSNEFVTTYTTPAYVVDIWYSFDPLTRKKAYDQGFIRISRK